MTEEITIEELRASMSWQYIAGFFDGEGSANKYKNRIPRIQLTNTNRQVLEIIRDFMQCGSIYLHRMKHDNWKDCYVLVIHSYKDVLFFCRSILKFLIIKKTTIQKILTELETRHFHPRVPFILGPEILNIEYYQNKKSTRQIAKEYKIPSPSTVLWNLKRYNIPRRKVGCGRLMIN